MVPADPLYTALCTYTKALGVALGYRDAMTKRHSDRVFGLAIALGRRCALSERDLGLLGVGAAFHDLGKIGIPDAILLKHGRLDDEERRAIQDHSRIGADILRSSDLAGAAEAADIIHHHHEFWNGTGYPARMAGVSIPFGARIISIVDSYDAMGSPRTYHSARTHAEVMDVLASERATKHDPWLLDAFEALIVTSPHRLLDRTIEG